MDEDKIGQDGTCEIWDDELTLLRDEITELENQLSLAKQRGEYVPIYGVPSMSSVLVPFSVYPIGIHVVIKLLCLLTMIGPDVLLTNLIVPMSLSTVLALYFSLPVAMVLVVLAGEAKRTYRQCKNHEFNLKILIDFLEKEIAKKEEEYENLKRQKSVVYVEKSSERIKQLKERRSALIALSMLRNQIIEHYENGTLNKLSRQIGRNGVKNDECVQFIKTLKMTQKKSRSVGADSK